jgi:hypothetical protein
MSIGTVLMVPVRQKGPQEPSTDTTERVECDVQETRFSKSS